jgi:hypothetical protein
MPMQESAELLTVDFVGKSNIALPENLCFGVGLNISPASGLVGDMEVEEVVFDDLIWWPIRRKPGTVDM